jgi:hypothetical protein
MTVRDHAMRFRGLCYVAWLLAACAATAVNAQVAAALPANPAPPPAAALPPSAAMPVRGAVDSERPPDDAPAGPPTTGFVGRLNLGVEASLWIGEGTDLYKPPVFLNLDLGYAFSRRVAVIARMGGWLRTGSPALEYFGVGGSYYFMSDSMFVTGTVGVSVERRGVWDASRQLVHGVGLQLELCQLWHLTRKLEFAVGPHFEIGTDWLGEREARKMTQISAGLFASFGVR